MSSFAELEVITCFILLLLLWIFRDPKIIPGFGEIFKKGFYTDATSAMIVSVLLFILPDRRPDFLCWREFVMGYSGRIQMCRRQVESVRDTRRHINGLANNAAQVSLECLLVAWRWFRAGGWCWGNSHVSSNTRCNNSIEILLYKIV
jgi:hypothetical protein